MEGFTYVDIFATKGIEYLLVIGALLLFIPFWRMVSRPGTARQETIETVVPAIGGWFHLPSEGMFYHQGHSWARPEGGNLVSVGIDDFARKLVGKIDVLQLPPVGSRLTQGEKAWRFLAGSKSLDMLSPVDGKIVARNEGLIGSPEKIGKDPYGQSWLLKVEVPRLSSNLKNLLSGALAGKWLEGVRENLLARMNYNLGSLSQDGGVPVEGIARSLDRERWDELVREYFLIS
ncbi:MAG: glycine cleavage system protein H [Smithellaceae bacterium]|nr:glycine cleavage system protein H [Smithellaceae bacterium]